MRRNNCTNFVFSSSCSTYGKSEKVPIREDHSQIPISPYGTRGWNLAKRIAISVFLNGKRFFVQPTLIFSFASKMSSVDHIADLSFARVALGLAGHPQGGAPTALRNLVTISIPFPGYVLIY